MDGVENYIITGNRTKVCATVLEFQRQCFKLGMEKTIERTEELIEKIRDGREEFYWAEYRDGIAGIMRVAYKELAQLTFVFVPTEKAKQFEKDARYALFGPNVYFRFKSAREDIKLAGTCMALELHTAAVFHLMRAAEVGLLAFAKHLKIKKASGQPVGDVPWGTLIKEIDDRLNPPPSPAIPGVAKKNKRKPKSNFYKEVSIEFREIKDLWRNPVSHGVKQYNEQLALNAFTHVNNLMRRLASKIHE